ncbi:MAG: PilZ domain-containing protein [Pseudomonadota bacterium]
MNTAAVINPPQIRDGIRIVPPPNEPINININGENFIDILQANDISLGGIGITVTHGFKNCNLNAAVSFIIELPIDEKKSIIKVQGVITHVSGNRFGVAFKNLPEISRFTLKKYIASKIKEESIIEWMRFKVGLIC